MTDVLDELTWRGLVANSTDEAALREHLQSGPVTFYVGFDPTAPSLHFGNLVQLIVARHLQAAGHRPLLLVGGSTGMIGDPKESGERVAEQQGGRGRLGGADPQPGGEVPRLRRARTRPGWSTTWTGPARMSVLDFLRDIGKHFPVNRMLARDVVRNRLEDGISYTEFSYVLLQSMDYLELFRSYGCTLQFGGSDQWGNITAGVELVRRAEGARVHALATPLLTKADGTKFGKTESGTVWLDPAMTSPYAFHQFFLNAEDAKVIEYLKVFTPRSRGGDRGAWTRQTAEQPHLRAAQKALADDVTALVHSEAERDAAVAAAAGAVRPLRSRRRWTRRRWPAWSPRWARPSCRAGDELPSVVDVLERSGVVASKVGGPSGDRRGRRVPQQRADHRPRGPADAVPAAARPLRDRPARQADGRRRHHHPTLTEPAARPACRA